MGRIREILKKRRKLRLDEQASKYRRKKSNRKYVSGKNGEHNMENINLRTNIFNEQVKEEESALKVRKNF